MAAKNALEFRRNGRQSLIAVVDRLIEKHMAMLRSPDIGGSVGDLVKLIQLARELEPFEAAPATVNWID